MKTVSKRPHNETAMKSKCIDCAFLSPTTVVVESLFSKCSCVMTASRRHMMPRLFEAIVCLKENNDWWNLQLVQDMVAGLYDAKLERDYEEVETYENGDGDDEAGASDW